MQPRISCGYAARLSSDKVIDDAYDKAIDLGISNPTAQGAIASGMDSISNAVGSVMNAINGLISSVLDEIKKILDGILKPIEQIAGAFGQATSLLAIF